MVPSWPLGPLRLAGDVAGGNFPPFLRLLSLGPVLLSMAEVYSSGGDTPKQRVLPGCCLWLRSWSPWLRRREAQLRHVGTAWAGLRLNSIITHSPITSPISPQGRGAVKLRSAHGWRYCISRASASAGRMLVRVRPSEASPVRLPGQYKHSPNNRDGARGGVHENCYARGRTRLRLSLRRAPRTKNHCRGHGYTPHTHPLRGRDDKTTQRAAAPAATRRQWWSFSRDHNAAPLRSARSRGVRTVTMTGLPASARAAAAAASASAPASPIASFT